MKTLTLPFFSLLSVFLTAGIALADVWFLPFIDVVPVPAQHQTWVPPDEDPDLKAKKDGLYEWKRVEPDRTETPLVIPEGATKIKTAEFALNDALTSVVIPKSVTKIEDRAFRSCSSLKTVVIPEGVTKIGPWVFYGCTSLKSVVIPESVKEIGPGAFAFCIGLKEWPISSNHPFFKRDGNVLLTKDGKKLVACLPPAKEYRIPEGVTEIGDYAFYGCVFLTSVEIPESVTVIGNYAFENCPNLTIHAPAGSEAEEYAKWYQIPFNRVPGK